MMGDKIHLGCGCVYLSGYVNVDAAPHFFTVNENCKEILEQNKTTFDKYYKHSFGKASGFVVADIQASIDDLPFKNNRFDEAIMIQVLEHFPKYKVNNVLSEVNRVLKIGGKFIVGVPDIIGTAKLLIESKTNEEINWCIRLIEGTQKNEWSHHFCAYTKERLITLLSEYGFGNFEDMPNINFYPSIHIKAEKIKDANRKE